MDSRTTANQPLTILIVEDERIIAEDLRMQLASLGFSVLGIAGASREAMEMAASKRPGVVLMDLNLSDGSSGAMAGQHIEQELGIPVIYLTGARDLSRVGDHDPDRIVIKPFSRDKLLQAIERVQGSQPAADSR